MVHFWTLFHFSGQKNFFSRPILPFFVSQYVSRKFLQNLQICHRKKNFRPKNDQKHHFWDLCLGPPFSRCWVDFFDFFWPRLLLCVLFPKHVSIFLSAPTKNFYCQKCTPEFSAFSSPKIVKLATQNLRFLSDVLSDRAEFFVQACYLYSQHSREIWTRCLKNVPRNEFLHALKSQPNLPFFCHNVCLDDVYLNGFHISHRKKFPLKND